MLSWPFSETGRSGDFRHDFGQKLEAMRHALEAWPKRFASLVSNRLAGPVLLIGIAQRRGAVRRTGQTHIVSGPLERADSLAPQDL